MDGNGNVDETELHLCHLLVNKVVDASTTHLSMMGVVGSLFLALTWNNAIARPSLWQASLNTKEAFGES